MAITDSTLRSSIFETIYDLINGASLEYYNSAGSSVTGVTVTAAYIDDEQSLPQVVINPANIAKDDPAFKRTKFTNNVQIMIDIYTKKNKNIDYITDQIDNLSGLKNIQGLQFNSSEESRAYPVENENKIHLKSITLNYKRR